MSLVKKYLLSLTVMCTALKITIAAVSHQYKSTSDYTISHEHFHDNVKLATPFLFGKGVNNQAEIPVVGDIDMNPYQLQSDNNEPAILPPPPLPSREQLFSPPPPLPSQEPIFSPPQPLPSREPIFSPPPMSEILPQILPQPEDGVETYKQGLPPGYVSLPALVDPPAGYQILKKVPSF